MSDGTCVGGECAEICPVYNPGGNCPTTGEFMGWFRLNRTNLLTTDDTVVH